MRVLCLLLVCACATVPLREEGGGSGVRGAFASELLASHSFESKDANCSSPSAACSASSFTTTGAYNSTAPVGSTPVIWQCGAGSGCGFVLSYGSAGLRYNTQLNAISTTDIGLAISSGAGIDAIKVITNGAFVHFGAGTNDKASSDGTTVTFAGPVASTKFTASGTTTLASTLDANATVSLNNVTGAQLIYGTQYLWCDSTHCASNGTFDLNGSASNLKLGGHIVETNTIPTVSSGFGASPSIVNSSGSAAFQVNVGTGGSATSGVIGFTTAVANGWVCVCQDITTPGANVTRMTANSTTTCTVTNVAMSTGAATAWTASDKLWCVASGD